MAKVPKIPIAQLSEQTVKLYAVLNEEKDLAVILIGTSFIDACLKSLLEAQFLEGADTSERLLQPSGIIGSFRARTDLCYVLGLIPKSYQRDLIALGEIRNRVAHHHLDMDFSDPIISTKVDELTVRIQGALADATGRAKFTLSVVMLANMLILNAHQLQTKGAKPAREPSHIYQRVQGSP